MAQRRSLKSEIVGSNPTLPAMRVRLVGKTAVSEAAKERSNRSPAAKVSMAPSPNGLWHQTTDRTDVSSNPHRGVPSFRPVSSHSGSRSATLRRLEPPRLDQVFAGLWASWSVPAGLSGSETSRFELRSGPHHVGVF